MTSKLPDKLSDLILLALEDLEKAEKAPDYSINLSYWHTRRETKDTCFVCFAGAVMAFSLGANHALTLWPSEYPEEAGKLNALDKIRHVQIELALNDFYHGENFDDHEIFDIGDNWPKYTEIVTYYTEPEIWKRQMYEIAEQLKSYGH